jgi:enoyl-CoA hydratase/3-hydroxyacyl-CoA dehydrogenase
MTSRKKAMQIESVKRIAVIGAGTMGHSIAEVAALAGYKVPLYDASTLRLRAGVEAIGWSMAKLESKGSIPGGRAREALARLRPAESMENATRDADVVIEVVPERLRLKQEVFRRLDEAAPVGAVLASNTSSLSVTALGRATSRGGQVVGMHFFTPPVIVPMVEVIRGGDTSAETWDLALALVEKFGKTPLPVNKDVRGFIVNRAVLGPYLTESAKAVSRGEATVAQVDGSMKTREGFSLGPFELLDLIGLDIHADVMTEEGLPVPQVIRDKVALGELGRKSGHGFYDYRAGRPAEDTAVDQVFDPLPLYAVMANEAAWLIENEVTTAEHIDLGTRVAAGFPKGVLERADKIGAAKILSVLQGLWQKHGDKVYEPVGLLHEKARSQGRFLTGA